MTQENQQVSYHLGGRLVTKEQFYDHFIRRDKQRIADAKKKFESLPKFF